MKLSVISALICLAFLNARAQVPGREFKSYPSDATDFDVQMRYFNATGNYTRSGNSYDSLPSRYSYENYQFEGGVRQSWNSRWGFFGSLVGASAEAHDGTSTQTNSALSEVKAGSDFLLTEGQIMLIPEASFTFPVTSNNYNGKTVAIGEGVSAGSARMIMIVPGAAFRFGAHAGFQYRDQGLSSLFRYGTLAEFRGESFALGAELRGYTSLGYDQQSDNELPRENYFCEANGCAKQYGAINPSLLESSAWLKMDLNRQWQLSLGGGGTLTGTSVAQGFTLFTGLAYRWIHEPTPEPVAPRASNPARISTPTFREEVNDGVDQNLFRIVPIRPPTPTPTPAPAAQPPANSPRKSEVQIQLKSTKKKRTKSPSR